MRNYSRSMAMSLLFASARAVASTSESGTPAGAAGAAGAGGSSAGSGNARRSRARARALPITKVSFRRRGVVPRSGAGSPSGGGDRWSRRGARRGRRSSRVGRRTPPSSARHRRRRAWRAYPEDPAETPGAALRPSRVFRKSIPRISGTWRSSLPPVAFHTLCQSTWTSFEGEEVFLRRHFVRRAVARPWPSSDNGLHGTTAWKSTVCTVSKGALSSSPSYSLSPSKKNPPRPETPAKHEALGSKNPFFLLLGEAIHFRREAEVQLRETAGVVGTEIHRDAVPRVRPVRMVLQLLGGERNARHEAEGFGEVGEGERAVELSLRARPAVKGGESGIGLGSRKFFGVCHGCILPRIIPIRLSEDVHAHRKNNRIFRSRRRGCGARVARSE